MPPGTAPADVVVRSVETAEAAAKVHLPPAWRTKLPDPPVLPVDAVGPAADAHSLEATLATPMEAQPAPSSEQPVPLTEFVASTSWENAADLQKSRSNVSTTVDALGEVITQAAEEALASMAGKDTDKTVINMPVPAPVNL